MILKDNTIRDTRTGDAKRQTSGILIEEKVGVVAIEGNQIEAEEQLVDKRKL